MQKDSLSQLIEKESWDTLAIMLHSMKVDVEGKNKKLRKLRKEMQFIKHLLYGQLRTMNGTESVDISLVVGTMKTVGRMEKELVHSGIRSNEFIIFLRLVLEKLKKQRLIAKKPMEMQKEFGLMKGVVENADLRETVEDRA